jgi:metal-sulfur cluster biosynthetic enzyme
MSELSITKEQVLETLSDIIDPELRINIVDLGLIYKVEIIPERKTVAVDMTLTSIACPIGPALMEQVHNKCLTIEGIEDAVVNMVFDPPWNPRVHATEDGKMELGIID